MLAFSRFLFASSVVSTSLAASFTVLVGADGLAFTPNNITAAAGDIVTFEFHPKNHTLTQSTLAAPCTALAGGGNSGFMAVAANSTTFPTKQLTVPDSTTPLWFFCEQTGHCGQGMVFAINPKSQDQMTTYIANAKATVANTTATSTSSSASASATADTTTSTSASTSDTASGTTSTVSTPSASSTSTTSGNQIAITVGANGALAFSPSNVNATVGDTINFSFLAGSHTVTQSTFAAPCSPMSGGFNSGAKPVAGAATTPTFSFTVNDTKPIWVYCQTGTHCQQGMVFSVNAPETGNTFSAFQAAAKASTSSASASASGAAASSTSGTGAASARYATGLSGLLFAAVAASLLL